MKIPVEIKYIITWDDGKLDELKREAANRWPQAELISIRKVKDGQIWGK